MVHLAAMRSSRRLAVLATLAASCCGGPARMPAQVPTARALLERIHAHQRQARTLRAEAKVEFWDHQQGDRIKGRVSMWVTRAGNLRVELNTQLGPMSALAVTGDTFQLLDVHEDKFYVGQAAPCNVEHVLHIRLPPAEIAAALLGDAPVAPHREARVSWNGAARRWTLTLALADGGTEIVELGEKSQNVERAELRDRAGRRIWWLEHEDFETVKGVAMPEKSRFQQGDKADQEVLLRIKSQDVNLEPPPGAWVIEAPIGIVQQEMQCR